MNEERTDAGVSDGGPAAAGETRAERVDGAAGGGEAHVARVLGARAHSHLQR